MRRDRAHARSVSALPTAAIRADAMVTPTPGIVVSRRASSFSFAQRTNSASKAAIRRSSSRHCARASATSIRIRGLNPSPPCSSISTIKILLELPLALRHDDAALQQDCAQLIDQSRSFTDQPVSRSMKRLHVELVLALQSRRNASSDASPLRRSLRRRDRRSSAP